MSKGVVNKRFSGEYYPYIDSVKGLALLMVIAIHTGLAQLGGAIGAIGRICGSGAQFFFVISAFLAYSSIARYMAKMEISSYWMNSYKWVVRKILHLLPAYYVAIVLYILIVHIRPDKWDVLLHILLLNGFSHKYINSIIIGGWCLANLFILYIIIPVMYRWVNNLYSALLVMLLAAIVNSIIGNSELVKYLSSSSDSWNVYLGNQSFIIQFPVVMMGIVVYYIIDYYRKAKSLGLDFKRAVELHYRL